VAVEVPRRAFGSASQRPSTRTGRRRPSGEPPPLPRELRASGKLWLVGLTAVAVTVILAGLLRPIAPAIERIDVAVLEALEGTRTGWLSSLARGIDSLGSAWVVLALRWGTILVLLVFRRWRHLATFVGAVLIIGWFSTVLTEIVGRPRPYHVEIIGDWEGFSMPSAPVTALAGTLVGMGLFLFPEGRWRTRWLWASDGVIALFAVARMHLGVDHPTDALIGVILGMGIMVLAFRFLVPEEAFPVNYRRGRAAHLDVGGRRGEAIKSAVADQLGLEVVEVQPFGLEGSGGSTPLRLEVMGESGTPVPLFGKLYAQGHLRADRTYKFWRTILYGRLEDEKPFSSVRHLLQQEDYMLRVFRDAGIPVPATNGVVEITPEREYLVVTEFLEGAREIGKDPLDDRVIDSALSVVRKLWDAGLAHRDIKPANLLVRDGSVVLIDVAFAEVRPTPWRQAVDLANMMLVLGLYAYPRHVYARALRVFTAEDLAEAFAAARGVASPSQLRAAMKRADLDLLKEYRRLAPEYRPIRIQRWSVRRIGVTVWALLLMLLVIVVALNNLQGAGLR
jgi:membrane-associated phospholipid phosphatase